MLKIEIDENDSLSIEHKKEVRVYIFHKSIHLLTSSILNNNNNNNNFLKANFENIFRTAFKVVL